MTQRAYRGRQPNASMDAATLLRVVERMELDGIDVWLDGGWGVDALLGHQTREHDDLDLVAELRHSERIIELLEGLGYELVDGAPPKCFVLVDSEGRQVDVHPVAFEPRAAASTRWTRESRGFIRHRGSRGRARWRGGRFGV